MEKYFDGIEMFNDVVIREKECIMNGRKIILWGAGFNCVDTIQGIGKDNIEALFDNDSSKWGKEIMGITIRNPKELGEIMEKDTPIVISTSSHMYEIARELIDNRKVREEQLYANTKDILEKNRFKTDVIQMNANRIKNVYNMLQDKESKEYYINFIKGSLSRNPLYFRENPRSVGVYEYKTDEAEVGVSKGDIIVDAGAYIGDSAKLFLNKTEHTCEVYCFEPVKGNYNVLKEWIEKEKVKNVFAYNLGLGACKRTEKIYSKEEVTVFGSFELERSETECPVINEMLIETLDDVMDSKEVDYIKMDIEGAEMSALRGASHIIETQKPQMLISAYHRIEDMWEIPEYVLSLNPAYKVFCGSQPYVGYEPEFIFV